MTLLNDTKSHQKPKGCEHYMMPEDNTTEAGCTTPSSSTEQKTDPLSPFES
jgi:hypothetical protein